MGARAWAQNLVIGYKEGASQELQANMVLPSRESEMERYKTARSMRRKSGSSAGAPFPIVQIILLLVLALVAFYFLRTTNPHSAIAVTPATSPAVFDCKAEQG